MLVLDSAESESESITVLSESLTSDDNRHLANLRQDTDSAPRGPDQKVKAECFARLGRGTEHAKWNSANVSILVDGEADDERILTIESTGALRPEQILLAGNRRGQPQAGRVSGHGKGTRIIPALGFDPTHPPPPMSRLCARSGTPASYARHIAIVVRVPVTAAHTCLQVPVDSHLPPPPTTCVLPLLPTRGAAEHRMPSFPGPCGGCAVSRYAVLTCAVAGPAVPLPHDPPLLGIHYIWATGGALHGKFRAAAYRARPQKGVLAA